MTQKNFVLDTNVLLHEPGAIFRFADNNVVIPIYVIEEIDTFKKDMTELGRNAREVSRLLDRYRGLGSLRDGVPLEQGGVLRVAFATRLPSHEFLVHDKKDNQILSVALELQEREPERPCIMISKDVNLRVRADALGLTAENYAERDSLAISELHTGTCELEVPSALIDQLHAEQSLQIDLDDFETPRTTDLSGREAGIDQLVLNQYMLMRSIEGQQTKLARVIQVSGGGRLATLEPIGHMHRDGAWGIKPRNKEQFFALHALLDDRLDLVTLVGKAGTGKTLAAIAAGLRKVTEEQRYHKLLVARPVIPMGRDIGFLPGTMEEKLGPWMRPIFDNVEFLMGLSRSDKRAGRGASELIDMGIIEIEALTYIRGRSLPNQYIIIDEAQNLTPHEAKTILTRVGEGTKIVLTGDPYQIDNPYVDSQSNGLSYVLERFKGQENAATISLVKGERSRLAELAANLL